MRCHDFLEGYSDFRDGTVLDRSVRAQLRQHLLECSDCERHDRVLRAGLQALRSQDPFKTTLDLTTKIEAAVQASVGAEFPSVPRWAGLAALVMVLVGVALLAASVVESSMSGVEATPALQAVPYPRVVANAGVPFVTFQDPRAGVVLTGAHRVREPPPYLATAPVSFR